MNGNRKYRVGMLLDSLVGGGAERISLNFAEKFVELGHDAHVFILRNEIEHDVRGIPVHPVSEDGVLSRSRPINKLLLALRLRQRVAEVEADGRKFDFFISSSEDADRISGLARLPYVMIRYRNSMRIFLLAKLARTMGLKRRIREIRWLRKFRRIYGGRHIVTVSRAMEEELVHDMGIRPASITTIYNPFNFERLRALAAEPAPDIPAEPYIVYAARISNRKNQELLIRAYVESGLSHKLVLLGGTTCEQEAAYERKIRNLIVQLGLEGRVLLPGFRRNPYPWIKHAALFAMSSDSEGLPTVVIESLILGTPAVSTDCPTGPSEILEGPLAEFLSPVGDVAALAANMKKALQHYPRLESDQLLERFRDDQVIQQYLRHYQQLTGARGAQKL
ncbi:MAG TPA: glycosyltransferase [Rhodocyclaceae bacterium]|nr:glycosyltransferase [Rhodocyclaceae bacterium]